MTTTKTILGVVPGLQATALVGENLKLFKFNPKKKTNFKVSTKKFVKTGVKNLVGIGLISATAGMINKID